MNKEMLERVNNILKQIIELAYDSQTAAVGLVRSADYLLQDMAVSDFHYRIAKAKEGQAKEQAKESTK